MKENKNSGFEIPKDYFEKFEERLFAKLDEDVIPKEAGFSVPGGYFDIVEEDIMKGVVKTKVDQPKVIGLNSRRVIIYVSSIAASVAIIFGLIGKYSTSESFNDLQISTIESYIEEGNVTIDSYEIASLLADEDIENGNFLSEPFSDESLETYLLDNIDDSSILIE